MTQTGKSDKNKTRWRPEREDIYHIIREHKAWLESEGREGHRAEIYNADLSEADFYRADLRGAQIWDTYLYNADLREANLIDSNGIKPEQLAGADLSGAILPEDIEQFDAVDDVKKHSKKARRIFWGTLVILHFTWIMLLTISNANLLSRIYLLPSIMPDLYMPSFWFFTLLPTILLGFYIAFHLNLQRNWEKIAELPAFFPDDVPINKKIHGWHVNRLILPHLKLLNSDNSLGQRMLNALIIYAIRWLVPFTLTWLWLKYLIRHDWGLSIFHITIVSLSILFAFFFQFLTRRTLQRKNLKGSNIFIRFGYLLALFSVVFIVSFGIIQSVPQEFEDNSFTIAPKIAGLIGYNLFLDFSEGEISKKPANWNNEDSDISTVTGIDLKDLYAPYSNGRLAFLVNADLSFANLKYNNLDSADLRGANLTGAKLTSSSLIGANLEGANLTGVHFEGVNLLGANLNNVKGLTIYALHKTENWLYAQYGGAILDSLNLPVNHNEKIIAHDLSGYDLSGVNFRGADLAGFNFSGANLQSADLTDVDLTEANLFSTDLRGVIGLDKAKIQKALNWFFAIYDEELMAEFNMPADHIELTRKKDFRTYIFKEVNLSSADFKGANLREVNMKNAILINVDLQDADLYAVDLSGADLTGANFKSTILLDTDIRGANLTDAKNLTMEQLRWAIFDSATIFPDSLKDPAAERLQNR